MRKKAWVRWALPSPVVLCPHFCLHPGPQGLENAGLADGAVSVTRPCYMLGLEPSQAGRRGRGCPHFPARLRRWHIPVLRVLPCPLRSTVLCVQPDWGDQHRHVTEPARDAEVSFGCTSGPWLSLGSSVYLMGQCSCLAPEDRWSSQVLTGRGQPLPGAPGLFCRQGGNLAGALGTAGWLHKSR